MINKLQTILYLLVFGSFKLDKQNQSYGRKKKLRLPYFNSKIRGATIIMTPSCTTGFEHMAQEKYFASPRGLPSSTIESNARK